MRKKNREKTAKDLEEKRKIEREIDMQIAKYQFEPEEDFQELYNFILGEGEFAHNGYWYYFAHLCPGWAIIIEDLNDENRGSVNECYTTWPREQFATRADLVSQFKLRNDGRTLLEYWCDYFHKPRMLFPPVPKYYPHS